MRLVARADPLGGRSRVGQVVLLGELDEEDEVTPLLQHLRRG